VIAGAERAMLMQAGAHLLLMLMVRVVVAVLTAFVCIQACTG